MRKLILPVDCHETQYNFRCYISVRSHLGVTKSHYTVSESQYVLCNSMIQLVDHNSQMQQQNRLLNISLFCTLNHVIKIKC